MYKKIRDHVTSGLWERPYARIMYRPLQIVTTTITPIYRDITQPIKWIFSDKQKNVKFHFGTFSVSPTTYCNGKCVFCAYRKGGFEKGYIEDELFKKAIDEMVDLGIKKVTLNATVGEVLLDPTFYLKIKYIKDKGLKCNMYTNGLLLLMDKNYEKLVDLGIDELDISMSDFDPQIEAETYGVPLGYAEKKIEGIIAISEYNHEKKNIKRLRLVIRPSRNPVDVLKHPSFKKIKGKIKYEFNLGFDNWGGAIKKQELVGQMKLIRSRKWKRKPCNELNNFNILPNGDVRLCGCRYLKTLSDDLVVGNIHKETFQDIIDSGRIEKVKQRFIDNDHPKSCKNCTYYST